MKKIILFAISLLLFIQCPLAYAEESEPPPKYDYRSRVITTIPTTYGSWVWSTGYCSGGQTVNYSSDASFCRDVAGGGQVFQQPCYQCGVRGSTTYGSWSGWSECPSNGCPTTTGALEVERRVKHSLSIDYGGGVVTDSLENPFYALPGQKVTLEIPSRAGSSFVGWTHSGGGSLNGNEYTFSNASGKVRAQWELNVYDVTFLDNDDNIIDTQRVTYGEDAIPPVPPTLQYYLFAYWSRPTTNITNDLVTKAIYTRDGNAPKFSVDFETIDSEYGSYVVNNQRVYSTQIVNIPPPEKLSTIVPEVKAEQHCKFLGWYYDDLRITNSAEFYIESDLIINAKFYPDYNDNNIDDRTELIKVYWESDGGTYIAPSSINMNTSISKMPTPTKEGFNFDGWHTSASSSNKWLSSTKVRQELTLYAKWVVANPNHALVAWETDGGSEIQDMLVNIGSKITAPTMPTKVGYIFDGWYTSPALSNKWYFSDKVDKELTLYAKWVVANPKHISISWETMGGSEIQDMLVNIGSKITAPTAPTKDAYVFEGWYNSPSLSDKWYFSTKVSQDLTLYANWSIKQINWTDTLPGSSINLNFINSTSETVFDINVIYGQPIIIINSKNETVYELAARQDKLIQLPNSDYVVDHDFEKWNINIAENDKGGQNITIYPTYIKKTPPNPSIPSSNNDNSSDTKQIATLLVIVTIIIIGLLLAIKVVIKSDKFKQSNLSKITIKYRKGE